MALKSFTISNLIRGILNDPVHKDFYVLRVEKSNGDKFVSPVMDHANYMIYEAGLRAKTINGEIKYFCVIGRGSEDDVSDIQYQEADNLNKTYS